MFRHAAAEKNSANIAYHSVQKHDYGHNEFVIFASKARTQSGFVFRDSLKRKSIFYPLKNLSHDTRVHSI